MGFSLAWVAVRGLRREKVLEALGLRATGEHEELPESELVGAALPSGWYLVVADHFGILEDGELARALSKKGETVACWVEEHVMFSMACGFEKGKERWRVSHDSSRGLEHLETSGSLPASFAPIRDEHLQKQRAHETGGVDYLFDVPVELARSLTDYRHDHDIEGAGPEPFEILEAEAD
jgi:hypothetical protein